MEMVSSAARSLESGKRFSHSPHRTRSPTGTALSTGVDSRPSDPELHSLRSRAATSQSFELVAVSVTKQLL